MNIQNPRAAVLQMKLDPLATITQEKPHREAKTKSSPDNKSARMKRSYSLQM